MKTGISLFFGIEHDWNEIVFIASNFDFEFRISIVDYGFRL
ncbi:hypothetical protein SLEP1_g53879 [Rubroshorea leprosula]|uniref:Uncharacterized protein n=1 Tax=Rubroshorea leprosula TaxID=152421 RepID=A0AAV5MBJ8_9ROSI|nr:hypothetical protein SLEP1_g53879 [Rubroshorea leprosula]